MSRGGSPTFRRALWRARLCGVMQGVAIVYGFKHKHRHWCPTLNAGLRNLPDDVGRHLR